MKFAAPLAGLCFGLIVGIPAGIREGVEAQSLSVGITAALFLTLIMGTLFGLAVAWLSKADFLLRQSQLVPEDLLPGERLLETHGANLIVLPKDFGLQGFACDDLFWAVGMKDREALGGSLHVTNYRLLFKTHRVNRLRGSVSIFFPTIRELRDDSFLIIKKLSVHTLAGKLEFVVGRPGFVQTQVDELRRSLTSDDCDRLREVVLAHPQRVAGGLETWNAAETVNRLINLGKKAGDLSKFVSDPLGTLSSILLGELFDRTLGDRKSDESRRAA